MDTLRASSNIDPAVGVDGIRVFGMNSHKDIEAIMQSSANGEVIFVGFISLLSQFLVLI